MTGGLRTRLATLGPWLWLATLAVPGLFALLALRTCTHELAYAGAERPDDLGAYVPEGYYDVVNREVAPHLELCPLNPQDLALMRPELTVFNQAAVNQTGDPDDAGPGGAQSPCDAPCADGRLSVLFCLRRQGLPPEQAARIRRFIEISPLRRDLRIFSRWRRVSGPQGAHRMALVDGARRQVLPLGRGQRGFTGRVLFRDSAPMLSLVDEVGNEYRLGGPGATVSDLGAVGAAGATGPAQAPAPRVRFRDMVRARDAALRGKPTQQHVQRGGVLTVARGDHELRIIAPSPTATQVIVEVPQRAAGVSGGLQASIDGVPLDSHEKRRLVGLEDGQQLQLAAGPRGGELTLRFFRRQSAVLSERRRMGDHSRRVHDEGAGFGRYLDTLVTGLSEANGRLLEARTHCGEDTRPVQTLLASDLRLTLDERLQHGARAALDRYAAVGPVAKADEIGVARRGPLRGLWVRKQGARRVLTPPPVMSLTVMDAATGELLALASYPSRKVLRGLGARLGQGLQNQPDGLLREHLASSAVSSSLHLKPHVIGSVFKPLLAWGLGRANAALLDVPLTRLHPQDWPADPTRAPLVDQCLLPVGSAAGRGGRRETRFHKSMPIRPLAKGCGGRAIAATERADVCAAIGSSDTYWFVHLAARAMLQAMGEPIRPAEEADASSVFAPLDRVCAPRRHEDPRGRKHWLCVSERQRGSSAWFPTRCAGSRNPFCTVAQLFDVQVQAIGAPNPVASGERFLGELYTRLDGLGKAAEGACLGVEGWRKRRNSGLLWALPRAPQWSQDLMKSCAQLTMFVQGGFINYWNNVWLAQALARVATGRRISARLVQGLVPPAGQMPPRPAASPASPTFAAIGPTTCQPGDSAPLCKVREGMRLAVTEPRGTLAKVRRTEQLLNREARRDHLPTLELRGKTGSGSELRPHFVWRRDRATQRHRWQVRRGRVASIHTALLATFKEPGGERSRTFVVYLWVEGVDEDFTSVTGAVPFFLRAGVRPSRRSAKLREDMPGLQVLRSLRSAAHASWRRAP